MTNESFHVLVATLWAFICNYTWAILIVIALVVYAIRLGRKIDSFHGKVTSAANAAERFSKKSLEAWRNAMFASWRLGVGALLPTGIVFGVSRNLPEGFLNSYVLEASQGFKYAEVFFFVQALIFISILCVKFRAISDCHKTLSIAEEAGI